MLLTWTLGFQMKLNVSEVPSLTTQVATSLFPLYEVQGEIFSARKAASHGEK